MRIGDLLRCSAVDADGVDLGRVHDVRLVQDGPLQGPAAALRLDALVIGGPGVAVRIGIARGGVRGPWLLVAGLRRLERRAVEISWTDVASVDVEHRRVHLRVNQGALWLERSEDEATS